MMNKNIIILTFLVILFSSCNTRDLGKQTDLEKIEIFNEKEKVVNRFFLNFSRQKDSIEEKYEQGKLKRKIFWKNGTIDSIKEFNTPTISEKVTDSLRKNFDKNGSLIQKSEINYDGEYDGFSFKYKDSILSSATEYVDGNIKGLVAHFNKESYPTLVGNFEKGSFFFGIQFYEKGKVKTLRINDKENRLGLIYHYHPNGTLKSKVELLDGVANGVELNFDKNGTLISKRKLTKGVTDN